MIGDGALTGGMAWEALNNIAAGRDRNVVIVVNDNGRSYAPTIGGLADRLASLRLQPGYERVLEAGKDTLRRTPVVGRPIYTGLHALKAGVKDALSPQALFADLGLKYFGPVDGHDVARDGVRAAPGPALRRPGDRARRHPQGLRLPARRERRRRADAQPGGVRPGDGPARPARPRWAGRSVFAEEMVALGHARPDVVAITAAMLGPTGLAPFAEAFPDRCFDVGIAEQHALTSAAGLAAGGLHPVVAIYSTFLNRAFDQLLMDVALHRQAVTLVLDRAGVTGNDGPVAQRDVGPVDPRRRARASGSPRPATPTRCARSWPRPSPSTTGRPPCASRRAPVTGVGAGGAPGRRGGRAARARRSTMPTRTARRCCWCAWGRSASWASRRRRGWRRRASR